MPSPQSLTERDVRLAQLGRALVQASQAVTILSAAVTSLNALGRDSTEQKEHLHDAELLLAEMRQSRQKLLATMG